jgi:hypothetical protein
MAKSQDVCESSNLRQGTLETSSIGSLTFSVLSLNSCIPAALFIFDFYIRLFLCSENTKRKGLLIRIDPGFQG